MRALVCGVGEKANYRVNGLRGNIGGRVFRGVTSQKLHTERMLCQEAVESEWIYYSFFLA